MILQNSNIQFSETDHRYTTADGVQLQSVSALIRRQLFADKYTGVPAYVLDQAAERGTNIHELCELIDTLGVESTVPEAVSYVHICKAEGLQHEKSEYMVTDGQTTAGTIDKVYRLSDDEFLIGDLKTTYKFDTEYVRWQTSIYAYLFECQNPGCKVTRLAGIWLRGEESLFREVERIPVDVIRELIAADREGRQFDNPYKVDVTLPERYRQIETEIEQTVVQAAFWEEKKRALQDQLMQAMVAAGAYTWQGDAVRITRRKDGISKTFDRVKFEQDHPDLYREYLKDVPKGGCIIIKTY